MLSKINYYIFTILNIGKLPASGTFGSLFAIFFYYFTYNFFSETALLFILFFFTTYSLIFLKDVLNNFKDNDPKEVIIDEFIGQLIPLIICKGNLFLIIISFISFRFFDILKIFPANVIDKKIKGPVGIIGDDIIAGLYSLILIFSLKIYI